MDWLLIGKAVCLAMVLLTTPAMLAGILHENNTWKVGAGGLWSVSLATLISLMGWLG